jgi:hypothetical protein
LVVVLVDLVVVLVDLVVVAALVVEGLVLWQVAPLQKPVMAPLMHGTPCFLRTLVSQVMAAEHLGLLWHGPILFPQICPALLIWHWRADPGALQHGPPSQVSTPSLIPFPQKACLVKVPVKDPVMEVEKD